jgi:hypothetical protein
LKSFDQLEMPPIVGQDGEAMMQCGGPNQKVEVANCFALGSEPAAFATKYSRDRVVDTHQFDAAEKSLKCNFRRDGAKRSCRNGAAELSEARARRGEAEIRNHKLAIPAIRARRASIIRRATTNAMKNRNKAAFLLLRSLTAGSPKFLKPQT